jgi:outer membrane lipoprotein-sorting protein
MPGLEARFVEEKKISLLAKPLVSRGRLFFTHPGLLRRTVESPRRSVVVVTPTAVHISANGKTKSIDLRRLEDVGALVQSLVWILAGNRAELERAYRVKMRHEDDGSWLLVLTPKAEPLSNLLAQIRISGRGLAVARVHVVEASGDETTTRITSADPARRFSPQEMRRLFTASAP